MPKPLAGQTTTRQERLSRYRMIERALPIAAQHAATGHLDRRIEAALAAGGCGAAFANRAELAGRSPDPMVAAPAESPGRHARR